MDRQIHDDVAMGGSEKGDKRGDYTYQQHQVSGTSQKGEGGMMDDGEIIWEHLDTLSPRWRLTLENVCSCALPFSHRLTEQKCDQK